MSSCILPLLSGRISFRCFGISCFVCIVLSSLGIFLAFILSPVLSDLFPHVVYFNCLAFLFLSQNIPAFYSVLAFNSVLLFVELCVNNLFIFSVSISIVFQSWLLRDGNVVFFSDIILFIIPTFIFFLC